MRVAANTENSRPEKSPSKVTKKKAKPAGDEETAEKTSVAKNDKKSQQPAGAKPTEATRVELSSKAKPVEAPPKTEESEMRDAERLMDHVNTGKLSAEERELAMKRVGDILKKYGRA